MSDDLPDIGRFGAALEDFLRAMTAAAQRDESQLAARLRDHLGVDPGDLAPTVADFPTTDHPNLQLALDAVLPEAELVGYSGAQIRYMELGLVDLLKGQTPAGTVDVGPVQYADVEVGDGRVIRCVASGLFLGQHEGVAVVAAVSGIERPWGGGGLKLELISPGTGVPSALLGDLRAAMRERNVYRGKVISLHQRPDQSVGVSFLGIAPVAREAVILPNGTLERLERHAIGIADQATNLRKAGRHLKRGILLHGPPGTGKTLSVNYLLGAMPGRTTVVLTGRGLGLIEQALAIARELAPATVVFEDIDLVAAERMMPMGDEGVLFTLLNEMEGLAEDADLLFLLTTNRPDIIEPALAARPGRVDLAVELPLPDEAARHRLLGLYAGGIQLDEGTEAELVERTEGVSGAFVKELMRQAALRAALDGRETAGAPDVLGTLDELLEERSALTRRLLGQPADGSAAGAPGGAPSQEMLRAFGAAGLPLPPGLEDFSH
jgi:histone H3/H4